MTNTMFRPPPSGPKELSEIGPTVRELKQFRALSRCNLGWIAKHAVYGKVYIHGGYTNICKKSHGRIMQQGT